MEDSKQGVSGCVVATRVRDKKVNYSKNQKDTLSRAPKVWSPDFLKFRQLLPENKLPVGLRLLKIEINFGLDCEIAICADCSEHIHQKAVYTSGTGVNQLGHILEHVIY